MKYTFPPRPSFGLRSVRGFRCPWRSSAFAFVSSLGIWLPESHGATLVDLDATQLAAGALATWTNSGSLSGNFTSAGTVVPAVTNVLGAKGVAFQGGTTGPNGTHYIGPAAPASVVGASARSVEAWVYNPSPQAEENVFSWGRRGGPDGSNVSFGHGTDATFGAVGQWGAGPDISWNGRIFFGRWTYIAYTYDGGTATVYSDGEVANSEAVALDTWDVDNTAAGNPLPFRIARQNLAAGTPSGVGVGQITIAKIRVHDTVLDAAAIAAKFAQEKAQFGLDDADADGIPDWYEGAYTFLNPNDAADAPRDQDNDGLTNLQEFQRGTLPNNADTDGDGINDGPEVNRTAGGAAAPTNPLLSDTDGDGLSDKGETGTGTFVSATDTGTNPLQADTDGDGFGDWQEVLAGSNPNSATSTPGAARPSLVNLDATLLPAGSLTVWTNNGGLGGTFVAPAGAAANIQTNQGVKGVVLNGTSNFYTGPAAPAFLTGNASRTIEAWILNPTAAAEETIFSWGRRGGPDGSNTSFNHGLNAAFGAIGHWGGPDIGWGDAANVKQGQWTYVAYTYDGTAQTTRVYSNGAEANFEELANPLNTHAVNTAGGPLPFRVGSQNEANGNATGGLRGSMTIAEIRVFDRVLDPAVIQSNYTAGTDKFGLVDIDNDGLPTWYERQYTFLNPNDPADAARDQDADALSNLQEFQRATAPDRADTDGDGVADGAEVNRTGGATNPLVTDSDQDGLSDQAESGTGTFVSAGDTGSNPVNPDSDGDGFADGQEVAYGSNPNIVGSVPNVTTPLALVNLDATTLPLGALEVWTNTGPLGGVFTAAEGASPAVASVQGVKGVTFNGTTDYYTGPSAPVFFAGNASRTIEAWILNPAINTEETVFAWGRRGGPDGSNASYIHGTDGTFGAMGHWGAGPDVGWNGSSNIVAGRWTFVAYTYDGATQTATAYKDGAVANSEAFAAPLNTFATDIVGDPGRPLPFRVGIQNNADASPGGQFASLTIGRIRAYDQALSAQAIAAKYNEEQAFFTAAPADLRIEGLNYDRALGTLNFRWNAAPGQAYTVESSTDLSQWTPRASGITSGSFSEPISPAGPVRFYRLRAQ